MRVVSLMNPAGSTAKSTTAAAIAHLVAGQGRRVLAVDLDPQANLTAWLGGSTDTAGITQAVRATATNDPAAWPGIDPQEVQADLQRQVRRTIQTTAAGVSLIAADPSVRGLVRTWTDLRPHSERLLADLVDALSGDYDVVVLDCKGDFGVLAEAALRASTDVVGVATPTTKALEGLQLLAAEAAQVGTAMRAVIPVQIRHRSRGADADDLYGVMRANWPTTPPVRGVASMEGAYLAGQPITQWDSRSPASEDYALVVTELVERGVL